MLIVFCSRLLLLLCRLRMRFFRFGCWCVMFCSFCVRLGVVCFWKFVMWIYVQFGLSIFIFMFWILMIVCVIVIGNVWLLFLWKIVSVILVFGLLCICLMVLLSVMLCIGLLLMCVIRLFGWMLVWNVGVFLIGEIILMRLFFCEILMLRFVKWFFVCFCSLLQLVLLRNDECGLRFDIMFLIVVVSSFLLLIGLMYLCLICLNIFVNRWSWLRGSGVVVVCLVDVEICSVVNMFVVRFVVIRLMFFKFICIESLVWLGSVWWQWGCSG